jgi:hypothetical protein
VTLDGGMNNKFQRSIIEENESPDCANVTFSDGSVGTRDGVAKLNTAAIGSFVIDGIYTRHADTDVETMVVFAGGSAWQLGTTSFTTISSGQSVFTAGFRVAAAEQENHLFIGNGGVIPYKWNGTDFTRHGVYPPVSAPAVASASTGAAFASGSTFSYKVTFVNTALVESDVGPVVTHVVTANSMGNVALTGIPVAPQSWGVGYRRLYRTTNGGSTFKRVIEIANNTTTTYEDAILDASLGVTAPTDNGVPPKYSVICYHQSRLFMNDPANPDYIWWSELGQPYTVASTNFMKVGDASGDTVRTISVYENSILVSCSFSQWLIYMTDTDPSTWEKIRVKSPYGSESPFGFFDYNNKQCFPAIENGKFVGFAAVSGAGVEASATFLTVGTMGSLLKSERIEPDMFLIQEGYLKNISAITYKNKAYIAVTYGNSNVTNNRIYQFDYSISNLSKKQKEAWVPWTGLNAAQFTVYNGNLYYGSSTANGFVYKMEAGAYNDDGAAIDSYFWTKEFSGYPEDYNNQKDFRFANLLIEKPGNYRMTVAYRTDSDSSSGSEFSVDLNPGTSLWGTMIWGIDAWSENVSQQDYTLNLGGTSGKRIQFKFSNQNTVNQSFKVHGINFSYNLKGQR